MVRPGTVPYLDARRLQERMARLRGRDAIPDALLLLEHPHTYTLGRRGNPDHVLLSPDELAERGVEMHWVDRGGDVTYHGPGQLVGYPILKLPESRRRFVSYIRDLEAALLEAIRDLGVAAVRKDGFSGVWVGDDKVCAIGVKVDAAGVTSHGFALNVDPDMSYFTHIVPCGLVGKGVTSLHAQLGSVPSRRRLEAALIRRLSERFSLDPVSVGPRRFGHLLGGAPAGHGAV